MLISQIKDDIKGAEAHIRSLYIELQKAEAAQDAEFFAQICNDTRPPKASPVPAFISQHPEGTKLKWILNEKNYRVVTIMKNGVLQTKSVTNGSGEMEEAKTSRCRLKKTFFKNEMAWLESLPCSGIITVTKPSA